MEIFRVIVGSTGLIGSAWKRFQPSAMSVERSEIRKWLTDKSHSSLEDFLDQLPKNNEIEIHLCFGNTNSTGTLESLMQINCDLPFLIAKEALKRNYRVFSYGSALEDFGIRNNYFESKRSLTKQLMQIDTKNLWSNIRLHTLYSDSLPHSHMFLGQIYIALQNHEEFKMTSGNQLREFHHVDDVIEILDSELRMNSSQQVEVSHGKPLQLIHVAHYLFEVFASQSLLNRYAYPDDPLDNYTKIFTVSPVQDKMIFRETLPALESIFTRLLKLETRS